MTNILRIGDFISESKKVIRRNLPIRKYKIIDCHYTSEICRCDNCDKLIKNIATIEDEKHNVYNVGLDCAETLSGITEFDIEYWQSRFAVGKKIRAKLLKYIKEYGNEYYVFIDVPFSSNLKRLYFVWHNTDNPQIPYALTDDDSIKGWLSFEEHRDFDSLEDIVKYCPDIADKCMYNKNWGYHPEFDTRDYSFLPKSGQMLGGYKIEYGIKPCGNNDSCSYARITKNGKILGELDSSDGWTYNVHKKYEKKDAKIKGSMMGAAEEYAARLYYYCKWLEGADILSNVVKP